MNAIQRLRDKYLTLSATHTRRAMKVYDHCPHCEEKTPWMVRVVTGFFQCLQCGQNPLDGGAHGGNYDREPTGSPANPASRAA